MNAPLRPGQIRSPWPRVRLADIAEHRLGKMLDKAKNTGVPRRYLRNPNVRWFDVDLADLQEILVEEKDVHKYELQFGDVVICEGGEAGRAALWKDEAEDIIFQKAIHRVRVGPRLDARFLIHRLMYDYFNGGLDDYYTGATIKHFTGQDLARYEIPLPPLDEQRRIAAILDKTDTLRRRRRRAIDLLDSLAQAIFLEMFGDPESNLRGFQSSAFEPLLEASPNFGSMIPPKEEVLEWVSLRVANIQNWNLTLKDSKFIDLPQSSVERHTLRDGDIILARAIASEEHLGKCVVVRPAGRKWAFDSHLMRIRLNKDMIDPVYVRELFRTPGGRRIFLRSTRKTTVQYNINTKELRALRIPLPPINLQREFVSRVTSLESIRDFGNHFLARLDHLFSSLQHRAFSGQL